MTTPAAHDAGAAPPGDSLNTDFTILLLTTSLHRTVGNSGALQGALQEDDETVTRLKVRRAPAM